MTYAELRTDVWEAVGKQSDLDPDTYGLIGEWINRAMGRIIMWKFRSGRQIRFRCTEGELFFQTVLKTGTAEAGATGSITLQSGEVGANNDQYNGWVVEIDGGTGSGQKRLIVDYDGNTRIATVGKDWDTDPDATSTYKLYKRFMEFLNTIDVGVSENIEIDTNDTIYDVFKVIDVEDELELKRGNRTESFPGNLTSSATPSSFIMFEDKIVFNSPIDEERWYKLEYFKLPADMSADDDEPPIPSVWHEAIAMWAIWKGLMREQEPPMAYAMKRNLSEFMETTIIQESVSDEREESYMSLQDRVRT